MTPRPDDNAAILLAFCMAVIVACIMGVSFLMLTAPGFKDFNEVCRRQGGEPITLGKGYPGCLRDGELITSDGRSLEAVQRGEQ